MSLTINRHTIILEAIETKKCVVLVVKTDKGEYREDGFSDLYGDGNDGLARMLFESLAPLGEAELYPTFAEWCKYMDEMGDDFSPRDENRYNVWRKELEDWQRIADGLTCDETLQYLSDNFNI